MKKFALRGLITVAVVVALCIFFSGTVRTLTTPKVRFAQAKMGRMETETELKGKVVFPETEELILPIPEGINLTVTRVRVAAGDKVKSGATLLNARVTDADRKLESLKKDLETARKDLAAKNRKLENVRLTRSEQQWQTAWEKHDAAQQAEALLRVELQAALRQAGLALTEKGELPEEAGDDLRQQMADWQQAQQQTEQAAAALAALERYAIPETTWTAMQEQAEAEKKITGLEDQITELQVWMRTAEKITAPRASYVAEVSVEKGSTLDGDTVLMKLTAEKADPVIRVDLTDVKQEVKQGTVMQLEADSWERPSVKVVEVGLTLEGHPYADLEINKDAVYAMGSVGAMMKNDIKVRLNARSQESTCLLPASAVRGSGSDRYVYVGTMESSTFGGSRMVAEKKTVTVLAESGSTVSVSEDLSYDKVLYMEDRALTEGGAVMEYARTSEK